MSAFFSTHALLLLKPLTMCPKCVCVRACLRATACVSFLTRQTVPVKKMKADEISSLLESLGFYKRSQKGEEVPPEFQNFPLHAPRDEL